MLRCGPARLAEDERRNAVSPVTASAAAISSRSSLAAYFALGTARSRAKTVKPRESGHARARLFATNKRNTAWCLAVDDCRRHYDPGSVYLMERVGVGQWVVTTYQCQLGRP
jgi:hypothetical protein